MSRWIWCFIVCDLLVAAGMATWAALEPRVLSQILLATSSTVWNAQAVLIVVAAKRGSTR